MGIIRSIYATHTTSVSELKKNPMAVVEQSGGSPVAVLNRNKPAFYCITAEAYEALITKLERYEGSVSDK